MIKWLATTVEIAGRKGGCGHGAARDPPLRPVRRSPLGVDNFLGGMCTPQLVAQYGGIDEEPEINARVKAIFDKVAPVAREVRGDLRYEISVLKSDIPNAFSLPGGRTFITRGLVELLDD